MTSYVIENEAKNLQNGDVHLAQVPDLGRNGISREPFGALRSVMAHFFFFSFFTLFNSFELNFFSTGVSL